MSIVFDHVSFHYGNGRLVLNDISMDIADGATILLIGENGAGKSTFLKLLNGTLRPTTGVVKVCGQNTQELSVSALARRASVTFQHPGDQIFAPTVYREVEFAPRNLGRPDTRKSVQDALALFGLDRIEQSHPYDLQPAQRKLLTAASAVASGAPILALDEPTAGISHSERLTLLKALQFLKEAGHTLVLVTHDAEIFGTFSDLTIVLFRGKKVFEGTYESLLGERDILRRYNVRLPMATRLELALAEQKPRVRSAG